MADRQMLSTMDLSQLSRAQLEDLVRQCGRILESRDFSSPLAAQLAEAQREAEYWKGVADRLEFGEFSRPDLSRPNFPIP